MSNIKENSIIALLDVPEYMKMVLDTSIWIGKYLNVPVGLLYSTPSDHKMKAVNYSGCLTMDEEEHLLHDLENEDFAKNLDLKNQGKQILQKAQEYCTENGYENSYPLHRQCSIEESVQYIDGKVELIVTGDNLTCKTSLKKLIRPSHTPILVTHAPFNEPKSAMFAFDNKETSHRIVEELATSALSPLMRKIPLHIVMVAENDEYNKDALREAYAKLTQSGIQCVKKLIDIEKNKDVATALLNYQQEHQLELLITGAFGQSRLLEWINGSETEELLSKHQTPYLLFSKA